MLESVGNIYCTHCIIPCMVTFVPTCRFVQFSYSEGEKALHGLDDGVFFVRKVNENEYEICLRYELYCTTHTHTLILLHFIFVLLRLYKLTA